MSSTGHTFMCPVLQKNRPPNWDVAFDSSYQAFPQSTTQGLRLMNTFLLLSCSQWIDTGGLSITECLFFFFKVILVLCGDTVESREHLEASSLMIH